MLMFPQLTQFTDLSLLLLRLMVAAIFITSGWSHLRDPKGRAESIGMSPAFTTFLGAAELAGGLGVAFGVLTQLAAIGLILVMPTTAIRSSRHGECPSTLTELT